MPVQGRQHVDVFDQDQVAKGARISDDNHSGRRSAIALGRQFLLTLLQELGAGCGGAARVSKLPDERPT
jgi:hypothetical protein